MLEPAVSDEHDGAGKEYRAIRMTEKLFWSEPYQREFAAHIVEQFPVPGGQAVVLDRTCFYATSGGQPHDTGTLNGQQVRDVRMEENRLLHIVQAPVEGTEANGTIDWPRRFDHMQQHSGQHILSAAFFRLFHAETSSFHLGEEFCSIELSRPDLKEAQIAQAEQLANEVITSATPVTSFFVEPSQAKDYPLRKQSDLAESLRIVQIGDFDLSPCSGTHIRNTGEAGMIFVYGFERLSQTCKITFLCGNRVRNQYRNELSVLKGLSKSLTTSIPLLPDSVTKLQNQIKDLRKENAQLKEKRLKAEAMDLLMKSESWNDWHLLVHAWNRPYDEVRFLAIRLSEQNAVLGALVSTLEKRVVFFKHPGVTFDLKSAFAKFLSSTGAKGGGPSHFLEAGNFSATPDLETNLQQLFR